MTARNDVDRIVSDWLADEAGRGAPRYLEEVLARTTRTRQRPAWSSLESWLPASVQGRAHLAPIARQLWFIALVGAALLALALLLLAGVGQHRPPTLGAMVNGNIAFVDGSSIRFADANGTVGLVATTLPDGADELTFSPDGRHLAYRTLDSSTPSIVLADSDGTHPIVVRAGDAVASEPFAWSPDSRRVAFVVSNGDVESIAVVDADGTHLGQLVADDAGAPLDPAWSPDGSWIAFFAGMDGSSTVSLIHPDGSDRRTLSIEPVERDGLAWSPDPARLRLTYKARDVAHSSSSQGYPFMPAWIRVYDLAAAKETSIVEATILSGTSPTWAPDGTRISWWDDGVKVVTVADAIAGHAIPWTVLPSIHGGCSEHADLAGEAVCGPARWSPDSRWLFGLGVGGTAIVFGRSDGSPTSRAIVLDHPNTGSGSAAWQSVTP